MLQVLEAWSRTRSWTMTLSSITWSPQEVLQLQQQLAWQLQSLTVTGSISGSEAQLQLQLLP